MVIPSHIKHHCRLLHALWSRRVSRAVVDIALVGRFLMEHGVFLLNSLGLESPVNTSGFYSSLLKIKVLQWFPWVTFTLQTEVTQIRFYALM